MLGNALNVSNNVQVTKAQKRDKKAERLRKRQTALARREQTLPPLLAPPFFISPPIAPASLIDWYVAVRKREQAAWKQACASAIAQCSLDTRERHKGERPSGRPECAA